MRILLVNWQDRENPQAGGAEIHLHEIFGRLAARGHEVTLLCSGWAGAVQCATIDGIEVHRVGTRYTFQLHARRYYQRKLARLDFDVLVEDINKVPLLTPRWGVRRKIALVPHLFGGTAFQELPAPVAALVWLSERVLPRVYRDVPFQAISQSTAADLVERGIPRHSINVIYVGVDSSHFTPNSSERSDVPLFSYLGRLKKYKGVEYIIRAFAAVTHPDARLQIAGTGDHRPRLEKLVKTLGLGPRVSFLGFVTEAEKIRIFRRSWAMVLASPKEGWGMTNLEAAACGTPVVASDSPGIRESVRDGETGYLVPHGDVQSLTDAMGRFVSSPELVEQLGRGGRSFAETFTWERAALETESHLRSLVDQ